MGSEPVIFPRVDGLRTRLGVLVGPSGKDTAVEDRRSIVLLYREWYKPQNVRIWSFWMAVQWIDHVEQGAVCRHVAVTLSFLGILIGRWV